MAAELELYERFMGSFNVTNPRAAFEAGYYVPLPNDPVAQRIGARVRIQRDALQAIVGGVGLGKTTQMFAIETALADLSPIYVDVGAVTALSSLKPSLLLTLAGREIGARLEDSSEEVQRAKHAIDKNASGSRALPEFDDDVENPYVWEPGVVSTPDPIDWKIKFIEPHVQTLLEALGRRAIFLFDGLDRTPDLEAFRALLEQDLRAFRRLGVSCVLVLPEQMLFGPSRGLLDGFDDWHPLVPVDVKSNDGASYLRSLLLKRSPSELLVDDAVDKLVSISGGVPRDVITLARSAADEAFMAGGDRIDASHVTLAADRFGRKRLFGLSKEQIEALLRVRKTGDFVETNESDVTLLATGRVLQYARPNPRFEVHPTLLPLLRAMDRAA